MTALPLTISERDFDRTLVDYATRRGWLSFHAPVSSPRPGRYMTAGTPGFVDRVFARNGVVLLVETKRHGGKPTPLQREWLAAAGSHGRLWTPAQWQQITEELA